MTSPSSVGQWYEAVYRRYDAPVFCRKYGDDVQVLSRKGLWTCTPDAARDLMDLGGKADAEVVERKLKVWSTSEQKRPNHIPVDKALPSLSWYRAAWIGKQHLGGPALGASLFITNAGFGSFLVTRPGDSAEIYSAEQLAGKIEVLVDVDGEYVRASDSEHGVLEYVRDRYLRGTR